MQLQDTTVPALLDSGALHNFVHSKVVKDYEWKLEDVEPLAICLAGKTQVISKARCSALVTIAGLKVVQQYRVIDCAFPVVLGIPFLRKMNRQIDWETKGIRVYYNSCQLSLPTYQVV